MNTNSEVSRAGSQLGNAWDARGHDQGYIDLVMTLWGQKEEIESIGVCGLNGDGSSEEFSGTWLESDQRHVQMTTGDADLYGSYGSSTSQHGFGPFTQSTLHYTTKTNMPSNPNGSQWFVMIKKWWGRASISYSTDADAKSNPEHSTWELQKDSVTNQLERTVQADHVIVLGQSADASSEEYVKIVYFIDEYGRRYTYT